MDKQQLEQYWEALHYALERELVDEPPEAIKALRKACKRLEKHLARCPNGDELIAEAKQSILFAV